VTDTKDNGKKAALKVLEHTTIQ
jgi:hypothetical protein